MFNSRQPTAAAMDAHSWACLPLGQHHVWTGAAIEQALAQGRRLRAEAMARGDWDAASHIEEHLVVAEDRLAQHGQQFDAIADRVCEMGPGAHRPVA
jgi:hypothetical protein